MTPDPKQSLRIFTPIGCVGYGYSTPIFWNTIEKYNIDAIICDSGSTDSGPQKLALGSSTVPRESYEADLEPMVAAAHQYHVPTIIGSAGGDGSNDHVDMFVDIIDEIVSSRGYRSLKVLKIHAEIPKQVVATALNSTPSRISPCGSGVAPLVQQDVSDATRVVAQMGMQPILDAMHANPDFDMIICGRAYDPAPYAAFSYYNGFTDLGIMYHMGKIMECGAQCSVPKSREALVTVRKTSFDVTPLDPNARCTALSVAAHTLYEKSRPDKHYGPDGMLNLTNSTYTELADGRSVRVSGSSFTASTPESKWTIKLEGARVNGYHSMFVGGCSDPILISQIDEFLVRVKAYVASKCSFNHELKLTVYGQDNALNMLGNADHRSNSPSRPLPATIGILGQARASTQREANMVVAMARIACVHGPYRNQKATSGNFGMPTAPQEIPMGPVSEFNIYHLMTVDDPAQHFQIHAHTATGSGECRAIDTNVGPGAIQASSSSWAASAKRTKAVTDPLKPTLDSEQPFAFHADQLGALAAVVRAKNAGPFEVTFDVVFSSKATYDRVKSSGILSQALIADLYGIDESDVVTAMFWDQALAFKATVARHAVSGSWGEVDMHSSCQHAKLMEVRIPGLSSGLLTRASVFGGVQGGLECLTSVRLTGTLATAAFVSLLWKKYPSTFARLLSLK